MPHVTPHTLRRTYVSIMLLATNFDIPFVQNQVGHSDSKMTIDVYAQLLDRSKRAHGAAFDALLSAARDALNGPSATGFSQPPRNPQISALDRRSGVNQTTTQHFGIEARFDRAPELWSARPLRSARRVGTEG